MAVIPQVAEADALRRPQSLLDKLSAEASDKQLLERFVGHKDEIAFECLVRRHGAMVFSVCQRILNQRQDAEDAFQATFLVLVQKANSIRKPELLGNWLYGVACRIARKARTREARRVQKVPITMTNETGKDPTGEVEWRELLSVMDEELQQLPNKYRLPLVFCYLGNMTNEEAAEKLGWPAGSMSYRLGKAREMLQKRMQRRQRSLPAGFFASLAVPMVAPSSDLIATTVSLAKTLSGATAATAVPATTSMDMARSAINSMASERRFCNVLSAVAVVLAALGLGIILLQFFVGGFDRRGLPPFQASGAAASGCIPYEK